MFLHRTHIRLILLFVGLVAAILTAAGLTLQWVTRQILETELGRKLESVAGAASVMYREEELRMLLAGLGPRTEPYFSGPMANLRRATEVKRIVFFDLDGQNLLDTENESRSRISNFGLQFYRREVEALRRGRKAHSILFRGVDGNPTMTGFAPFFLDNRVAGGVGVDGGVPFLGAVEELKHRLFGIGLIGLLAAAVGAAAVSASITRPIRSLVASSFRIGKGMLGEPILVRGKSEIALLADTMEEMRKGLVERERELQAMLAGVAHEIRNPLGGIELFTGLLSDDVSGQPQAKGRVERIQKEIQGLKQIVDTFLEFARPQGPRKENHAAGDWVRDAMSLAAEEAGKKQIRLEADPGLDKLTVHADEGHFKRIALNLLRNAVQAAPQGGTVRITGKDGDKTVSLYFKDDGPGIPEASQEEVFKPFFTTREKGTGLGLSIVRKLAEANGGKVELARSGPGGTSFCVT
ncbi:MAG TPA: HAMP domain-containing sensor histidine kinase, partial [bacterium]